MCRGSDHHLKTPGMFKVNNLKTLLLENSNFCTPRISTLMNETRNVVDIVDSVEAVSDHLSVSDYDFIVLDLGSLEYDEIEAIDACNNNGSQTPSLVVLSPSRRNMITKLLDRGADDFILRPFEGEDFHPRVMSMLKRSKVINSKVEEYGALKLDLITGDIMLDNRSLELTKREHGVLEILFRSKGNMVSKDMIAARLFSLDDEADISSIRIYVSRLRQKIKGGGMSIRSVRGMGYSLEREK